MWYHFFMGRLARILPNARAESPPKSSKAKAPKNGPLPGPALSAPNPSPFRTPLRSRRVALYARVSTAGQTEENQLRDLREVAERAGWHVIHVFVDKGISGTRGRDARPGLDNLLKMAVRREVDAVCVWALDRLSRSLRELLCTIDTLSRAGVDLYAHKQALDTGSATGRAMIALVGVFAEFERDLLIERVRAGLSRARAEGKQIGRPRLPDKAVKQIEAGLRAGHGLRAICRATGCGSGTVQRIRREMALAEA